MIDVTLVLLGLLAALGLATYLAHRWQLRHRPTAPATTADESNDHPAPAPADNGACCGQHLLCERDSLLAGVSPQVEYYNDEELDAYRGTPADGYTDAQTEEFREVLYTMRPAEVPGWVRSLQLRGVEMPDALKPEVLLIVQELRTNPPSSN